MFCPSFPPSLPPSLPPFSSKNKRLEFGGGPPLVVALVGHGSSSGVANLYRACCQEKVLFHSLHTTPT